MDKESSKQDTHGENKSSKETMGQRLKREFKLLLEGFRTKQSDNQTIRSGNGLSRREFLKFGLTTAALVNTAAIVGTDVLSVHAKEAKEIPVEIPIPPSLMLHARETHLKLLPGLIEILKSHGYTSVTYKDVQAALLQGIPLPEKPVMISIDDVDCLEPSQNTSFWMFEKMEQVLAQHGFKGTFALITEPVLVDTPHQKDIQSDARWETVKRWIDRDGMEIATHTKNHNNLLDRGYTLDHIRHQIIDSSDMIEQRTGQKVTTLILPYGNGSINPDTGEIRPEIRQVCQEKGISFVVGISGGKGKIKPDPNGKDGRVFYTGRAEPGVNDAAANAQTAFFELSHFSR